MKKKRVVIVGHEASLKALMKHFSGLSEKETEDLPVVAGHAYVYNLNESMRTVSSSVLSQKDKMGAEAGKTQGAFMEPFENTRDAFWSKDTRDMQIFSAEQIIVPLPAPVILKNYCKEVIRANPGDIIKFSRE